ncbi:MAG: signal recognition particle receptor subunit alpha, partial [Nitrospinota bacterium]
MSFSFFSKKKTLNKEQIERVDQLPSTSRLSNLAATLKGTLKTILNKHPKFDKNFFDELEDQLILADIGVELTTKLIDKLKVETKQRKLSEADEVIEFLKETLLAILITNIGEPVIEAESSTTLKVILFIGVNGTGKTTSIGKLAAQLSSTGKSVLLAAGDTFRAA